MNAAQFTCIFEFTYFKSHCLAQCGEIKCCLIPPELQRTECDGGTPASAVPWELCILTAGQLQVSPALVPQMLGLNKLLLPSDRYNLDCSHVYIYMDIVYCVWCIESHVIKYVNTVESISFPLSISQSLDRLGWKQLHGALSSYNHYLF